MVIRFMASRCNFFSFALQSIPSASNANSQSTLAPTNLTRTTGESELVSRLHHACIESARTHPLLAASFIRKAALTDDGSHRRRRCLTWPPHMSWVTPSKIQRCGETLGIWKSEAVVELVQLHHNGTHLKYTIATSWNIFGIWKSNRSRCHSLICYAAHPCCRILDWLALLFSTKSSSSYYHHNHHHYHHHHH